MRELILFSLLVITPSLGLGAICPPPEVIAPCTCSETYNSIQCYDIKESFDLKGILDNATAYINETYVFYSFFIVATPLVEIPEGAIDQLKFEFVSIYDNFDLRYISPRAFNASRKTTKRVHFWKNTLDEDNMFEFLRSFESVETLDLKYNELTRIPDGAFQNFSSLKFLDLNRNRISSIGSKAFANSPALETVLIQYNSVQSKGIYPIAEDAFEGIGSKVEISLEYNDMEYLDPYGVQPFLLGAPVLRVGGEICWDPENCYPLRLSCDGRADWLCEGREEYSRKLFGFYCNNQGQDGYDNVWEYCEGRNQTKILN